MIDAQAGATCASGETLLTWSQRGVTWRGAWNSATAFVKSDLVSASGNVYIAKVSNTNKPVSNTTYWALFVQRGATGAPGAPGAPGTDGVSGYEVVRDFQTVSGSQGYTFATPCPSGKVVLGGMHSVNDPKLIVNTVFMTDLNDTYVVSGFNSDISPHSVATTVTCAFAS